MEPPDREGDPVPGSDPRGPFVGYTLRGSGDGTTGWKAVMSVEITKADLLWAVGATAGGALVVAAAALLGWPEIRPWRFGATNDSTEEKQRDDGRGELPVTMAVISDISEEQDSRAG